MKVFSIFLVSLFGTLKLSEQSTNHFDYEVYVPMSAHLREDSVYMGNFTVLTVVPFYETTVVMWSGDTLKPSFGEEWQSPKYLVPVGRKDSSGARFVVIKNEREELHVPLYVVPLKFPWVPKAEKIIPKPKTYVEDSIRMARIIDSIYSFIPIQKVLWAEPFRYPVSQAVPRFSAPYGIIRERYPDQTYRDHAGLDIAAKTQGVPGDTLLSMNKGVVAHIGDYEVFGKTIVIDHGGHITTLFCHIESFIVNVGDTVDIGQPVAIMGKTGNATNYSVHITTRVNNVAINPLFLIMWSQKLQTEKAIKIKRFCPYCNVEGEEKRISPRGPTGYRGFFCCQNGLILLYFPCSYRTKYSPVPPAGGSAVYSDSSNMFFVYAIYNKSADKVYIGQTVDVKQRIMEHNEKAHKGYTSRFAGKWELIYTETLKIRQDALIREKQLKSYRGREFVKKHIPR